LFIWMQVWSLEKEDTPHSFSSKVVLHYYKFYFLFCFFIFVNFYFKIIIIVFPFPCFICTARHWCSATVMTVGDVSLDDHIHSWYVCIWGLMITFIPGTFAYEVAGTGMSGWDETWVVVTLFKIHYMPGILWRECLIYIKAPF
jgi:hypothetical protein